METSTSLTLSETSTSLTLLERLRTLKDFRLHRSRRHELTDIIMITLCAVLGGGKTWEQIAGFGEDHQTWFQTFLSLPNGIPSPDTFARVFAHLASEPLQEILRPWLQSLCPTPLPAHYAIDGKT
jgi:hypothetical protein